MPTAYYLPVKSSNGLLTAGIPVNASNRVDIYDSAGSIAFEVVNVPDATPAAGGKFPIYDSNGVDYDLFRFSSSTTGTEIESLLEGQTSGDANTAARNTARDGEGWTVKARITNEDGFAYAYASFQSCTVTVYDQSTGSADIYTTTDPDLATVFQTDLMPWAVDAYGYNFALSIQPSELTGGTEGGHVYKVEVNLVLNTGGSRIVESWWVIRSEAGA